MLVKVTWPRGVVDWKESKSTAQPADSEDRVEAAAVHLSGQTADLSRRTLAGFVGQLDGRERRLMAERRMRDDNKKTKREAAERDNSRTNSQNLNSLQGDPQHRREHQDPDEAEQQHPGPGHPHPVTSDRRAIEVLLQRLVPPTGPGHDGDTATKRTRPSQWRRVLTDVCSPRGEKHTGSPAAGQQRLRQTGVTRARLSGARHPLRALRRVRSRSSM
ncbi:hypothetical protein EYF80_048670 [Liparis tanakae]|uniref:Uncharacterized protein n=1 Tax=Liparis tanakae TaxID=230148 RepID=A0A4Z2FJK2_9TELE|nr:hypothetical protein EYF80_048670 [Liparis tanakae]